MLFVLGIGFYLKIVLLFVFLREIDLTVKILHPIRESSKTYRSFVESAHISIKDPELIYNFVGTLAKRSPETIAVLVFFCALTCK